MDQIKKNGQFNNFTKASNISYLVSSKHFSKHVF